MCLLNMQTIDVFLGGKKSNQCVCNVGLILSGLSLQWNYIMMMTIIIIIIIPSHLITSSVAELWPMQEVY